MFAAQLNLGSALAALAVGGTLLVVVWFIDRRALRRQAERDGRDPVVTESTPAKATAEPLRESHASGGGLEALESAQRLARAERGVRLLPAEPATSPETSVVVELDAPAPQPPARVGGHTPKLDWTNNPNGSPSATPVPRSRRDGGSAASPGSPSQSARPQSKTQAPSSAQPLASVGQRAEEPSAPVTSSRKPVSENTSARTRSSVRRPVIDAPTAEHTAVRSARMKALDLTDATLARRTEQELERSRRRFGRRRDASAPDETSVGRPRLPRGAEAALASILEVVPDPRNTVKLTRDPTAEVHLTQAEREVAASTRRTD